MRVRLASALVLVVACKKPTPTQELDAGSSMSEVGLGGDAAKLATVRVQLARRRRIPSISDVGPKPESWASIGPKDAQFRGFSRDGSKITFTKKHGKVTQILEVVSSGAGPRVAKIVVK